MALAEDDRSRARLLREAAALAYVDDLEAPVLQDDDARHFAAVLRLRPGEIVVACDGVGRYRGCRVAAGGVAAGGVAAGGGAASGATTTGGTARGSARHARGGVLCLLPDTDVVAVERGLPLITVGFSLAKGDRTDWAVAKLAELGVDRIVPLVCDRTVARSGSEASLAKRSHRLGRIARAASMQARRVWLPEVDEPRAVADALAELLATSRPQALGPTPSSGGVALAEPGGSALSLATPVVLVGPEGGWSPAELAAGLPMVSLGDTILRVETAAVVAGALLTALRSGVVSPLAPGGRLQDSQ